MNRNYAGSIFLSDISRSSSINVGANISIYIQRKICDEITLHLRTSVAFFQTKRLF